ncbi:uncharacterized protein [Primulina huaijiensis]|uniref:uncharacterized protein n=1 Tax=Primulina huaijiensis TaxID=1492673 RepID=UPI003CC77065
MGCATSKLDDLPAVAMCRERCAFLDEAIRLRFALADAHAAYLQSLKAVGVSLHTFFIQDLDASANRPLSPVLNLPTQRKGDPHGHSSSSSENIHHLHSHSHSDSGSHLNFHSESDDEEPDSLHNNQVSSPVRNQRSYAGYMPGYENLNFNFPGAAAGGGGGGGFMHINYMKNQATPSVGYIQRPMTLKTSHIDESSVSASSYNLYPTYQVDSNRNPNPSSNTNYNYGGYPSYSNYGAGGGFYGGSSATPVSYGGGISSQPAVASSSKAPPSPPRSSGWDFLNPFDGFEKFYPAATSSRDSRDVREEEGIPDLEDEDDEVVKEVHGHQKFVDSGRSSHSKPGVSEANVQEANDAQLQYRSRQKVEMETDPVEYEVHMVDKKVVGADRSKDQGSASGFKPRGALKGDLEVVREIQLQFDRASESGSELSKFLEVGKLRYKRRHGVNHVSSKMLHLPMVPSLPSTSKGSEINMADPAYLEANQELETRSRNLSSTLHKLYLWEKKLYEEVKAEEKMRVLHDRKSKKLKYLDERGAEASKVDVTRTLVRSLSTKIKIAIQVVDKISVKINNLRDEELWPQLNDFIQGLTTMWKSMLECHRNQCQAIGEAKRLDAIAFHKYLSDAHFEATRQFECDLVNWTLRFSYWVDAQKGFVRALNTWLRNCLLYVPEETADGIVPFSPGRIGAPPVFVVCNQWWQSLERISEKEVVGFMRDFASNVLQLWDRDKAEMRQRMLVNKDDRKIKSLDKEDQKIQKEILALDRRMVLLNSTKDNGMASTEHAVYQSETTKRGSLQASLQHVLEAMEGFTSNSLKVYEELLQRIEEDHLSRDHERVS